jgi:excisionase family DNA binding protein
MCTHMSERRLLGINELSAELPLPRPTIRGLMRQRKISFLRLGHRTVRFDIDKVRGELSKYEVPAIS